MSVDRSLKLKGALVRHRNVLTRAERVARLKEEERWQEGDSPFGLPKVANRKVSISKKKAEAKAEGQAAVLEQAAAGAVPGAAADGGKAAPAGPAKAAAPAGKAAAAAPGKTTSSAASKATGQGKPGGGGGRR